MSLENKIKTALKWSLIGKGISQIVNWVCTFLTIRILVPDDYGLFAIVAATIALFTLINELGLSAAIIQSDTLTEQQKKSANGLIFVVNVAIAIVLLASANYIAMFFNDLRLAPLLQVMAAKFLIGSFIVVPRALLVRNINYKPKEILTAIQGLIASCSTLAMAYAGLGVWSLVYGGILANVFSAIAFNWVVKESLFPSFKLNSIRHLYSFSLSMLFQRVVWWLYTQADIFILKKLFNAATVGTFFTAKHLASLPQEKFGGIVNELALTGFSRIKNDVAQAKQKALSVIATLSIVLFPFYYGLSSTAESIVLFALGDHWADAILPLQILCLIFPLRILNSPISELLNALGHPKVALKGLIISSLVMLTAILIGVTWGITGVSVAWVVGYLLAFILFNLLAAKYTTITLFDLGKAIITPLFCSIAMWTAVYFVGKAMVSLSPLLMLSCQVPVGVLVYAVLIHVIDKNAFAQLKSVLVRN